MIVMMAVEVYPVTENKKNGQVKASSSVELGQWIIKRTGSLTYWLSAKE
jgi:hypothetical protein